MKSPVISSVGPGLTIGSPGGGPMSAELGQSGLTDAVTTFAARPGGTLCERIV
jgi:hypothetical protein